MNRHPAVLQESFISYIEQKNLKEDFAKNIKKDLFSERYIKSLLSTTVKENIKKYRRKTTAKVKDLLALPIDRNKFWISSYFGPRKKAKGKIGFHYGLDLAALKGTPVKAAAIGKVVFAGFLPGFGNNILLSHANIKTRYAHLDSFRVKVGDRVMRGEVIGTVGDSGSVRKKGHDASHLHFEVYNSGRRVNPVSYLPL